MAFTMRDFLQGLAVGAEQASQTYMQYIQYRGKKEYQDKQLALEERRTAATETQSGSVASYYDALSEREKFMTERDKKLMPLDEQLRNLEIRQQRIATDIAQGKYNAWLLAGGESTESQKILQEFDNLRDQSKLLRAQISEAESNEITTDLNRRIAEFQHNIDRMEVITWSGLNPDVQTMLSNKEYNNESELLSDIFKLGGKVMPRGVREAFGGAVVSEMQMAAQLDGAVAQYETTLMERVASDKDFKKELKKMLDADDEELPAAIHTYTMSLKDVPYYQRGQVLGQLSGQLLGVQQDQDYVPALINVETEQQVQPPPPDYSGMTPNERLRAQFENSPANTMLDRLYDRVNVPLEQPYLINQY